jgi:hypothetical protein
MFLRNVELSELLGFSLSLPPTFAGVLLVWTWRWRRCFHPKLWIYVGATCRHVPEQSVLHCRSCEDITSPKGYTLHYNSVTCWHLYVTVSCNTKSLCIRSAPLLQWTWYIQYTNNSP